MQKFKSTYTSRYYRTMPALVNKTAGTLNIRQQKSVGKAQRTI